VRSTTSDAFTPGLLFCMAPCSFFECFTIHFCCYCGPLLHEFHHKHSFPVVKTVVIQLSSRYTPFLKTFLACLVNACAYSTLTTLWFNIHNWNSSFITCYSYDVDKFIALFVLPLLKRVEVEIILSILCL
jgi:hypothetical protein